ncbi:MAG: hypothetical protein M3Z06_01035 [Actinomycetota bacterium]|nr:hypothetical protein [Actinomycetota bacterium]
MWLDQFVLVLALGALGAAALRVAVPLTASPPLTSSPGPNAAPDSVIERVLVAVTLAAGFVVCWTLALGLAGRSGSVPGLAAGPLIAWLVVRWRLTGTRFSLVEPLLGRWRRATALQRLLVLTLMGLAAGAIAEVARRPGFGLDALEYHLPDALGWLHSGHAGAVQTLRYDIPVGYYPITNEVLLSWVLGISRTFAPLAAWSTAVVALLLLALWRLLDVLRIPRAAAFAALAAVGTMPTLLIGINAAGPGSDVIAVSWLACAAALSLGAGRRPALLGPALVAAGLGVGTKTTVAPLAVVVLLLGAWRCRDRLVSGRWPIAGGAVGAALVGGPWYVRDLVVHGWPLWPFSSGPTGDRMPRALALFNVSFLSRPGATLSALPDLYLKWVSGGIVLIAGVIATPLLARTRAVLLSAVVAGAALLSWGLAPFTGIAENPLLHPLALTTVRYLLAPLCACAVALAVSARDARPLRRRVVTGALGAAAVASFAADLALSFPDIPTPGYLFAGAAAGALVGVVTVRLGALTGLFRAPLLLRLGVPIAAAVFLAVIAPGWLAREAATPDPNSPVLAFMLSQPGFASGSQPIGLAPAVIATLAGPHLRHPLSLIGTDEPCARVRERLQRGWVVVQPGAYSPSITARFDAAQCLRGERPVYYDGVTAIYAPAHS